MSSALCRPEGKADIHPGFCRGEPQGRLALVTGDAWVERGSPASPQELGGGWEPRVWWRCGSTCQILLGTQCTPAMALSTGIYLLGVGGSEDAVDVLAFSLLR